MLLLGPSLLASRRPKWGFVPSRNFGDNIIELEAASRGTGCVGSDLLALLQLLFDLLALLLLRLLHLALRLRPLWILSALLVLTRVRLIRACLDPIHAVPLVLDHLHQLVQLIG